MTAVCNNMGVWDPNPATVCKYGRHNHDYMQCTQSCCTCAERERERLMEGDSLGELKSSMHCQLCDYLDSGVRMGGGGGQRGHWPPPNNKLNT